MSWYLTQLFIKNKVKNPYLLDTFAMVLKFVAPQLEARDFMVSVVAVEERPDLKRTKEKQSGCWFCWMFWFSFLILLYFVLI